MKHSRILVDEGSRPYFPKGVRMHHDTVRDRLAVLGPERVYWPDTVSADILRFCDGRLSIRAISTQLAAEYAAPLETIEADVLEFVQSWTDLHLLTLKLG